MGPRLWTVAAVGSVATVAAATMAAACSFPDPLLLLGDAGVEPRADSGSTPDSGQTDAGVDARADCDLDEDGVSSSAAGCGGLDCDDRDARRTPDAGFIEDEPPTDHEGDWNCDGEAEPEYPVNFSCAGIEIEQCKTSKGFEDSPACGQKGKFITCRVQELPVKMCVLDAPNNSVRMPCR